VRSLFRHSLLAGGLIAVAMSFVCCLFCRSILRWMDTPEEIMHEAWLYLFVTFLTIPCNLFYNLEASVIRALGNSKTPFFYMLLSAVLNIIFDVLFIAVFRMNTDGAAWATALSQLICIVLCWRYMRERLPILWSEAPFRPQRSEVRTLLGHGVPMGLQFSITAIGSVMLQSANNALGVACATAFTAAMRIKMFFITPFENLGVAMATYCGQNLGAGQYSRIRRGIWSTTAAAMIYCALAFVFNYSAGRAVATLFVSPSEVMILQDVQKYLVIQSIFYPMLAIIFIFRNGLQGMGYSNQAMMAGVSELIARALVSFGLVGSFGYLAVCYANPAAWLFADGVLLVLYARVMRRLEPVRPQELKAGALVKAQR
jgi:Na+-driven multidrug efflux pump